MEVNLNNSFTTNPINNSDEIKFSLSNEKLDGINSLQNVSLKIETLLFQNSSSLLYTVAPSVGDGNFIATAIGQGFSSTIQMSLIGNNKKKVIQFDKNALEKNCVAKIFIDQFEKEGDYSLHVEDTNGNFAEKKFKVMKENID